MGSSIESGNTDVFVTGLVQKKHLMGFYLLVAISIGRLYMIADNIQNGIGEIELYDKMAQKSELNPSLNAHQVLVGMYTTFDPTKTGHFTVDLAERRNEIFELIKHLVPPKNKPGKCACIEKSKSPLPNLPKCTTPNKNGYQALNKS